MKSVVTGMVLKVKNDLVQIPEPTSMSTPSGASIDETFDHLTWPMGGEI